MTARVATLAQQVVRWQTQYGRHHLPWQQTRDPYRVWLSEIMLQQTQVTTVLDYYERFLQRFADVTALAHASEDEVLALWSGLGYYSRARNLFDADLALAANERRLWDHAQTLLPQDDLAHAMPRYTQGLMDLGATICLSRKPVCAQCPLQDGCVAARQGEPERYPVKTRKLVRKAQSWWLLVLRDGAGRVWLHKRPATGIWAGLHCLPVFEAREQLLAHPAILAAPQVTELPAFLHVLTHRDLYLHPVLVPTTGGVPVGSEGGWFGAEQWRPMGLPAPVRKFLENW